MSNDTRARGKLAHCADDSDPLFALEALTTRLGNTTPPTHGLNLSSEEWQDWCNAWGSVREECRSRLGAITAEVYRWLRVGLDDVSFGEARAEVDAARALVSELESADIPAPIRGLAPCDDGTETTRLLLSQLETRPLAQRNHALQAAVTKLARWRHCRRLDAPPPGKSTSGSEVAARTNAAPPSTSAPPTGTKQGEGAEPKQNATTEAILPALLAASDIAARINRKRESVTSFLTRFAEKYPDCRVENPSKRKNEPGYLYRTADVWPALEKWMKGNGEG